jgi:hypothetical protein
MNILACLFVCKTGAKIPLNLQCIGLIFCQSGDNFFFLVGKIMANIFLVGYGHKKAGRKRCRFPPAIS